MQPIIEYKKGKPEVKRVETFCSLTQNQLPSGNASFRQLLNNMDKAIKDEHPLVTNGSLNNCHGDWYEWLIAICAWNYTVRNSKKYVVLLLPNVSRFDVSSLYNSKLHGYILDLRQKVQTLTNVQLITSNPDFVVIDTKGIEVSPIFKNEIFTFSSESILKLEEAYKHFEGQCDFSNIVGYFSVKTSLRPDRRLQLAHEGSLMKAIYVHLQTRDWVIDPTGLKYFAASINVGQADRAALKTVATHSIINVQSVPQAAVDEVFQIDSVDDAISAFSEIIQ